MSQTIFFSDNCLVAATTSPPLLPEPATAKTFLFFTKALSLIELSYTFATLSEICRAALSISKIDGIWHSSLVRRSTSLACSALYNLSIQYLLLFTYLQINRLLLLFFFQMHGMTVLKAHPKY